MKRLWSISAITILSASLLLGTCAPAATSSTPIKTLPGTTPPATTTPAPAASTVKTASKPGIGDYLVDANGMTLYYFTKDTIGKSTAAGAVLAAWPAFNAPTISAPSNLNAADFATITRDDGSKQTTYKGWPLYYYAKDKAAGDTLGEAVGGVWFVIKVPFYSVMVATRTDVGNYLVDARGMALYYFTKDSVGKSTATAAILQTWPVFNPPNFIVPSAANAADFGSLTRDDGTRQATFKGWPLYYYAKDLKSGDTLGQGLNGIWFVIDPANFPPAPPPTTSPTTSPTPAPTTSPAPTPRRPGEGAVTRGQA